MSNLYQIVLFKLGFISVAHYEQICNHYARATRQYLMLAEYLQELARATPHTNIQEEIADVLHQADCQ